MWACGWSEKSGRCLRLDCRKAGPCDGFEDERNIVITENKLKVGAFYWVIPTLDPDTVEGWEAEPQPARYVGDGKWQCLNVEGASDWPMRLTGDEIKAGTFDRNKYQREYMREKRAKEKEGKKV